MSHELQMAYEQSCRSYDYDPDAARIAGATSLGRFCVLAASQAFCPITDATLPSLVEHMVTDGAGEPLAFDTEAEALAEAGRLQDADEWGETEYRAVGSQGRSRPARPLPEGLMRELPF